MRATLYNAAAVAMRAVDPSIKIGGPYAARPVDLAAPLRLAPHSVTFCWRHPVSDSE
ncbi:hypothetical protein OpiT1DRAFT_02517 [Opitutaceae bacterium TAV1]|nr:hypothetical protein OPIT5_13690 [Opitutaceae bacterium TAV5]EIP98067.1 hypothetical protein OpiT1DRAFT_02517 [Opitutaceae bacterium TAV1]